MDFSTLFRTKENLSLDKNTLTILRYIAIIGQIIAISIVFYYLNLPFPIMESYLIISLGLATNLYLQFGIKINQLKDFYAAPFLLSNKEGHLVATNRSGGKELHKNLLVD